MSLRDDREITIVEAEGSGVKWFLAGAILGAGLGLLFAPQSGERTRRDISRKARELKDDAGDRIDDLADEVGTRTRKVKAKVEDWVEDVTDEVKAGRRKLQGVANDARDDLERRLAEARARRRATIAADGVAVDDEDEEDEDEDLAG